MAEQTPQERLAWDLENAHDAWRFEDESRYPWHRDAWLAVAAAILNSDVIREMRQQDRREAWYECEAAWNLDTSRPNPYDQEASDGRG